MVNFRTPTIFCPQPVDECLRRSEGISARECQLRDSVIHSSIDSLCTSTTACPTCNPQLSTGPVDEGLATGPSTLLSSPGRHGVRIGPDGAGKRRTPCLAWVLVRR